MQSKFQFPKTLQDDERLDALLDGLERRAPSVAAESSVDGRSERSATSELMGDLRRVKLGMKKMDEKLTKLRKPAPR